MMTSLTRSALFSALFVGLMSSSALADFEKGIAAYEAGNLQLAYTEFREAADKGNVESQFNVGIMFEQGIAVEKDEKQALEWYRKAALQGNAAAQFNIGVLYENGRGTPVDFAQANEWYRKASAQGDAMAAGNLGMLYLRGDGVKVDKTVGIALLMLSATWDPSPDNFAKRNISGTRGLTREIIAAAQVLSGEMSEAKSMLVPLDAYLANADKPQPVKSD